MVVIAAQQSFYEAAAQVIPILLLVLAFELVRYRVQQETLVMAYAFVALVLGMIAGEVAALTALASGHDSSLSAGLASFGIGTGVSAVLMRAGLLARDGLEPTQPKEVVDRFELVIKILAIMVALVVTVILVAMSV